MLEDDNFIHMSNRAEAMRDHQHGAVHNQCVEGADNLGLSLDIQACRGFIQDQDWSIPQNCSSNCYTLPLTTREILPLLAYLSLVAIGLFHNCVMDVRFFRRVNNFFYARPWSPYSGVPKE